MAIHEHRHDACVTNSSPTKNRMTTRPVKFFAEASVMVRTLQTTSVSGIYGDTASRPASPTEEWYTYPYGRSYPRNEHAKAAESGADELTLGCLYFAGIWPMT